MHVWEMINKNAKKKNKFHLGGGGYSQNL